VVDSLVPLVDYFIEGINDLLDLVLRPMLQERKVLEESDLPLD